MKTIVLCKFPLEFSTALVLLFAMSVNDIMKAVYLIFLSMKNIFRLSFPQIETA